MIKVGLTGGIGSGKTVISKIFTVLNVPVYFADERAKYLMHHGNLKKSITRLFGSDAYVDGILNRKWISQMVFKDRELLNSLNQLVHPAVQEDFNEWSQQMKSEPYLIEEAALLIEAGIYRKFDYNILVSAPEPVRIERVIKRDNLTQEEVKDRIHNQLADEEKRKFCDFEIINDEKNLVLPQVLDLHNKFVSLQKNI